jgi:hypothetical protein
METKREALLAEDLENFIQIQIFLCFFKRARCKNQHHLQTKYERSLLEDTHISPPHLEFVI